MLNYAGCEPSISTSGTNQKETGHMVKRGSSQLRWAYSKYLEYIYWFPTMRIYCQKKLAEGEQYNITISHIVRKLVRTIYPLLKDNKPYEEQE
ncbi:hypothetical protein [Enterococcus faecalis]|uniref:hypothetical protein n=1 Tax=Enterococcus faecalis TaxID=1351 RepID=UPI003B2719BE